MDRTVSDRKTWCEAVLDFWFRDVGSARWYITDHALDRATEHRFGALWRDLITKDTACFLVDARTALSAIILFDQLPRNMFRNTSDAFASDPLALAIAKKAIDLGYAKAMNAIERQFLFMPFMHSEALEDQKHSLLLFQQKGLENNLPFAREHHDVIVRFGRFPHRNAALGRQTSCAEQAWLEAGGGW